MGYIIQWTEEGFRERKRQRSKAQLRKKKKSNDASDQCGDSDSAHDSELGPGIGGHTIWIHMVVRLRRNLMLFGPLRRNNVWSNPRSHVPWPRRARDSPAQWNSLREKASRYLFIYLFLASSRLKIHNRI